VKRAIEAGASGIVIGRKVWGRPPEETAGLLTELYSLVHD